MHEEAGVTSQTPGQAEGPGNSSLLLRPGSPVEWRNGVAVLLDEAALPSSDRKEIRFWSEEPEYRPASGLWENLRVKAGDLRVFEIMIPELEVHPGDRVLELGAGQGWASSMLKRQFRGAEGHASDVAPAALESNSKWAELFGVTLDGLWACQAHRTPFADAQFDCVFTFAAFHHFVIGERGEAALREMLRILRPGGRCVLLWEPCAPPWLYEWLSAKLNRIRKSTTDVDEAAVVLPWLERWAKESGADMRFRFDTDLRFRDLSMGGALRNIAVRLLPALGHFVPVGANITIRKRAKTR